MDRIFGWPGVYWTARILLIVIMGGGSCVLLLLLARLLRPKNVLALLRSDPPKLDREKPRMSSDTLAQIIARLEAMKPDYEELERLRRKTLLGLLIARGIDVPDAGKLDSKALQEILDREKARAA